MDVSAIAGSTTTVVLAAGCAALVLLALILLVLWRRARRAARTARTERAAAERERIDLELTLAEQGSRLRMIRELHEIAVHSVSVIISQAEGARYAATQDPSAAGRSAGLIEDAARATLADLRRVMTVVRDGEAEAMAEPELTSALELVGVMRDAGLDIEFVEHGTRHELRPGAELAVFRILQEALSNALAHGGEGTHAKVAFTWTDDGLQLLVEDDGIRAEAIRAGRDPYEEAQRQSYTVDDDLAALTRSPAGRGITEMRERTELFGGVFEAHTVPGVGFTVQAVFPGLRFHNGVHGVPLEPR
ncbi:sensor histidine kinase [Protaetiibacter intestinalis]|uniref:histidine kinase n=1 Tax=Protaetiibacter intestinalis TaxID=2419774 RepID=A0A387BB69_9MICO|nr:ATP-binding protein [Protaetiibacter intestinalis]AYF98948.1 ATP-binding protein [Protaetiibacter intestinalis]